MGRCMRILPLTQSFWWGYPAPQPGDYLAVRYHQPRRACGVRVLTGSTDGRDRCHQCRVRVCVESASGGECTTLRVGRIGLDGSLDARLKSPRLVRRLELLSEAPQAEWLIVRELELKRMRCTHA